MNCKNWIKNVSKRAITSMLKGTLKKECCGCDLNTNSMWMESVKKKGIKDLGEDLCERFFLNFKICWIKNRNGSKNTNNLYMAALSLFFKLYFIKSICSIHFNKYFQNNYNRKLKNSLNWDFVYLSFNLCT